MMSSAVELPHVEKYITYILLILSHLILYYIVLYYIMSCHVMSCYDTFMDTYMSSRHFRTVFVARGKKKRQVSRPPAFPISRV